MEKSHLTRMVVGGALCVLLTCSMTPAIALAGGGSIAAGSISGDTSLGQEVGEANRGVFEPQAKKPALSLTRAPSGSITLKLGSTYAIGAKASKGAKISYFAVTPGRVSVSKTGVLKARATGTAYVLVNAKKSGKVTKKVRVRVVSAKKYKTVKSISSKANKKALWVGQKAKIATKFSPKTPSNKTLMYKSLTPKVASVNAKGVVTGKAVGTAKVRVSSAANPKAKATVTVRIERKPKHSLEDYSWAQLKSISRKIAAAKSNAAALSIAKKYGFLDVNGKIRKASKLVALSDGSEARIRILGFRQDRLASGKLAGISFEFSNVPIEYRMNGVGTSTPVKWRPTGYYSNNEGGWALSKMRSWLNSKFYKKLPVSLRKYIVPAKKRTNNVGYVENGKDKSVISTTRDKLWLLSGTEVYGDIEDSWSDDTIYEAEGTQYKLYSDRNVTMNGKSSFCKKKGASSSEASWWWLRSPSAGTSNRFLGVEDDGELDCNGYAEASGGVSPGFCF